MYDPTVGRFLQEDPTGFTAGDANLNRYCGNSPTNASDPCGTAVDKPTPDPSQGMSLWQKFMLFVGHAPDAVWSQWLAYKRDQELLDGGESAIKDGYDRDRYNQLTMTEEQYTAWKERVALSSSMPPIRNGEIKPQRPPEWPEDSHIDEPPPILVDVGGR